MAHQALTSALRNITKKASHPNALVYEMQKARAKRIYLPDGQLRLIDGGREGDVLALGDGKEGSDKEKEMEMDAGFEREKVDVPTELRREREAGASGADEMKERQFEEEGRKG